MANAGGGPERALGCDPMAGWVVACQECCGCEAVWGRYRFGDLGHDYWHPGALTVTPTIDSAWAL